MIDLGKVYDLITQAFSESQSVFHWGDNAIIRGSLETLPKPERLDEFSAGDYFALVDIDSIVPEVTGNVELSAPVYHYSITLCRKGRVDDITKTRNDMVNEFMRGWADFWLQRPDWDDEVINIVPALVELESQVDVIAVQFVGTVSQITSRGGRLDE